MSVHVLPFALWHEAPSLPTPATAALSQCLPGLSRWLNPARAEALTRTGDAGQPSLNLPHEQAQARALGWPLVDGLLPWAAHAASEAGLAKPGDGSGWGFVTLCHWQVSHGLATLTDPQALALTEAEDQALWAAMQPFFDEDGLRLHRWRTGQWLVGAPALAQLPTAALERVIGEDVDAWRVGGEAPSAHARVWQRLQNEMQMLLYTHAVNAQRRLPVNSFWLHGTGALPTAPAHPGARADAPPEPPAPLPTAPQQALRRAWLARDLGAWLTAWQALDAQIDWSRVERLVLCGAHQARLYRAQARPWWQRLWPRSLQTAQVLAEDTP